MGPLRTKTLGLNIVLVKLRQIIGQGMMAFAEVAGLILSFSGATVALFLGKLFAAVVLGALTLGIFLRIAGRRGTPNAEPKVTPPWVHLASAVLTVVEVGSLAEATNLPVRVNQAGFEKQNWILVVIALLVLFFMQVRFFRSVLAKRHANAQKVQP